MENNSIRSEQNAELYTSDNIFVRNDVKEKSNDNDTQQTTTSVHLLTPETMTQTLPQILKNSADTTHSGDDRFFSSGNFGVYPSVSPSLAPADYLSNTLPFDSPKARVSTTSLLPTTVESKPAEVLSALFASSCPSVSFLDAHHDENSWKVATPSHNNPLVNTITSLLPFEQTSQNNNLKQEDNILIEDDYGKSTSVLNALSIWMVVTLALGFWFRLLVVLSKTAISKQRAKGSTRKTTYHPTKMFFRWTSSKSSSALPNHLRRPSFEASVEASLEGHYNNWQQRHTSGLHKSVDIGMGDSGTTRVSVANDDGNESQEYYTNHKILKKTKNIESLIRSLNDGDQNENDPPYISFRPVMSDVSAPQVLSEPPSSSTSSTSFDEDEEWNNEASLGILVVPDIIHIIRYNTTSDSDLSSSRGMTSTSLSSSLSSSALSPPSSSSSSSSSSASSSSSRFDLVTTIINTGYTTASVSDLSMSQLHSESSCSTRNEYMDEANDEASLGVLATDDIYTGNTSVHVTTYLSYCLEESEPEFIAIEKVNTSPHPKYFKELEPDDHGYDSSLLNSPDSARSSFTPSFSPPMAGSSHHRLIIRRDSPSRVQNQPCAQRTLSNSKIKREWKDGYAEPTGGSKSISAVKDSCCREENTKTVWETEQNGGDFAKGKKGINNNFCTNDSHDHQKQLVAFYESVETPKNNPPVPPPSFYNDSENTIHFLANSDNGSTTTSKKRTSKHQITNKPPLVALSSPLLGNRRLDPNQTSTSTEPAAVVGESQCLSPVKLRFSMYTSTALMTKRRLEAYVFKTKKTFGWTDQVEVTSSTALPIHDNDQNSPSSSECPLSRRATTRCKQVVFGSSEPATKDIEASLLGCEDRRVARIEMDVGSISISSSSSSQDLENGERDPNNMDRNNNDRLLGFVHRSGASRQGCDGFEGQRTLVALSCALLLLSVVLLGVMGIAESLGCQQTIGVQFDVLATKATSTFATIDRGYMWDLFSGELDRTSQRIYQELDGYCPKISPSLCDVVDSIDPPLSSTSSCDLDGVPLGGIWSDWLDATDQAPSLLSRNKNGAFDSDLEPPHDPLFHWLVASKDTSRVFVSKVGNKLKGGLETWTKGLFLALATGVGLGLLSVAVLCAMIAAHRPMAENGSSRLRDDNPHKENAYSNRFPETHAQQQQQLLLSPSSPHGSFLFPLCTHRIFAIVFWGLFAASWLIGLAFTVAAVTTADVCGSVDPNAAVWNLITADDDDDEQQQQQQQQRDNYSFLFYQQEPRTSPDGVPTTTTNTPPPPPPPTVTDFWKEQLRHCTSTSMSSTRSTSTTGTTNTVTTIDDEYNAHPGFILSDRIQELSHLAKPIGALSNGLRNLSSSDDVYQDVCYGDTNTNTHQRSIGSLEDTAHSMNAQVCTDAGHTGRMYLELTSCDHSPWLPVYNALLNDTICHKGLRGFAWTAGIQVLLLLSALVVWAFRSVFLRAPLPDAAAAVTRRYSMPHDDAEFDAEPLL